MRESWGRRQLLAGVLRPRQTGNYAGVGGEETHLQEGSAGFALEQSQLLQRFLVVCLRRPRCL